ncbi:MAG: hypothetical protein HGB08_02020 [Candidatus Moranbacteria bacterium]|nr:hypothetical protein [Candidatus Moranbacteria bacterium]
MSEKKIIIVISVFVLVVFSALSWREMKFQTGTYRNGWWGIYFNDPKGSSLDFTINNESKPEKFSWKVTSQDGSTTFLQGTENVSSGEKRELSFSSQDIPQSQKIIIKVTNGSDGTEKDIYKTLP